MSEFTQLEATEPVTVPAVEAKVYDKKWLSHFRINSTPEKAMVIAHLVPYNGVDTLKEPIEYVTVDNVFMAMQDPNRTEEQRTLLAQAMELILRAVKSEMEYQKALKEEAANAAPIEAPMDEPLI